MDTLEVLPWGLNKETDTQELLERCVVNKHQVIAFGDGENDVEMLTECVGVGVAVQNAYPAL